MQGRGGWRRRGIAVAAVVLMFTVVAPSLAAPAGAMSARAELAARRRKHAVSPAVRRARILAAMRAKGAAKVRATGTTAPATLYGGAKKPTASAGGGKKVQRALAAKRLAAKRLAAKRAARKRRAAAAAFAAKRPAKQTKKKSLSIPTLALLAVLPFLLIGIYLLAADYLRRRVPRKRSASLVITRVSDR